MYINFKNNNKIKKRLKKNINFILPKQKYIKNKQLTKIILKIFFNKINGNSNFVISLCFKY